MHIILLLKEQEISSKSIFYSHNQASVSPFSKVKSTIFYFRFRVNILTKIIFSSIFHVLLLTAKYFDSLFTTHK